MEVSVRTYEELKHFFGESEQPLLVTTIPFSEKASILYENKAAAELTGVPEEEAVGLSVGFLGQGWREGRIISSSVFDADMCLSMVINTDGRMKELYAKHAEYKQRMEEALETANEASQAKTKFLSEMSHDIRTPMNAIVGMTDIALKYAQDWRRVEDCLKKIRTASGHLMELVNEVLDMSRIESGKVTLMEEELQLADLVHSILVAIKPMAIKKNIRFHQELKNIFCENPMGDVTRLRQICINLLSNAVKYTQEGGEVWMRLEQSPGAEGYVDLHLEVEDTGIGMSPEFLKHIFDPFERERNTTFSKIEGTGLGMSITKQLVDIMRGEISVESCQGKGSRFYVRIPLHYSQREIVYEKEALRGKRVLILQGAEEKLSELPQMLDKLGMTADVAGCGMEAIDLINDADLDGINYFALLTNDRLEDLELSLLLPEICARKGKTFPVLLLSECDWEEVEYLFQQAGVTSFVPLPLFESRLAQALYACTEEGRRIREQERKDKIRNYNNCHILLVEDNALNMEIAKEIIGSTGAQVDTAGNGREAVDAFGKKPEFYYDLILMDIQMPVMDGIEATKCIRGLERQDASSVHIVAMTANAFVEDRQMSIEAGMNDHITKPLDMEQVLECLDDWGGGLE